MKTYLVGRVAPAEPARKAFSKLLEASKYASGTLLQFLESLMKLLKEVSSKGSRGDPSERSPSG